MKPTPETDAEERPVELVHRESNYKSWVRTDFARKLERERDDAVSELYDFRRLLHLQRDVFQKDLSLFKAQRDELLAAGDELLWALCPASVSMMTERERDALKKWNKAKGGDPAEWPEDLRVRQFPARRTGQ